MTLQAWLALAGVCFGGAASPGPSLLVVTRTTLTAGGRAGLVLACAHGVAVAGYASAVLYGLAYLAQGPTTADFPWMPQALLVIRVAGAGFLLYLAVGAVLAAWHGVKALGSQPEVGPTAPSGAPMGLMSEPSTLLRAARDGLLTGLLNPKIALWFTALFSQVVAEASTWGEKIGIVVLAAGIDVLWYALVVAALTRVAGLEGLALWRSRLAVPANALFALLLVWLAFSVVSIN